MKPRSADVKSLEALKAAKAAVVDYRETITVALSEAQSDVQRTLWWIQNDRLSHWQREIRRRTEKVNQARSELYRAQLAHERSSCIEQKKLLERAERSLAEAEQKLRNVRKWARTLDREMMLFRGQLQPLARLVDGEMPRAEGRLAKLLDRLDKYIRLAPPSTSPRPARRAEGAPTASGRDDAGPAPAGEASP